MPDKSPATPLPGLEAFVPSPLRRQYVEIKRQHPDAILFFRLGDFFETFDDDAQIMARELDIALTSRDVGRGERVPMAGIPCQAAEGYVARLIARGYRIALCEQIGEVPQRGLVERQVVRVITPGTLVEESLLPARHNNYLVALAGGDGELGLAYVDISTGEIAATQVGRADWQALMSAELGRIRPAEVLVSKDSPLRTLLPLDLPVTEREAGWSELRRSLGGLVDLYQAGSLEALGLSEQPLAASAAGLLVAYVGETQPAALRSLGRVALYDLEGAMLLDTSTRRGLELLANLGSGGRDGSLLGVLDCTRTAMGARLLRTWIAGPLVQLEPLRERQQRVAELVAASADRTRLGLCLQAMPDLERLAARTAQRLLNPRECLALARGLSLIPDVQAALEAGALPSLAPELAELDPCREAVDDIAATVVDQPPNVVGQGVIREGVSAELDELRSLTGDVKQWIARLERQERERTGVRALKIGYNRVFGYYIEVSTAVGKQPTDYYQRQQTEAATVAEHLERLGYIRRQTLVSAERYVTEQLKDYEARAERAQEQVERLERQLYGGLLDRLAEHADRLLVSARALARLDALLSLAEVAVQNRYCRPELAADDGLWIEAGRHPVVERSMGPGEFVPNDADLSARGTQIAILTGPNMAGKSTYLRQVALLVLMAQIGSFVPARAMRLGLADRIFTRVGAQDDIASGRSTFMVEMNEVAAILRQASPRSLVILDEVGRGTSTYDGVAIARAAIEYLHDRPELGCKTLFATHYHELAELEAVLPRARAFRVEVLEQGDQVVFLHRVVPGGADRSYGIHVARLAGVPDEVTSRAWAILDHLERGAGVTGPSDNQESQAEAPRRPVPEADGLRRELAALDVDGLTPLEALNRLHQLVQRARNDG